MSRKQHDRIQNTILCNYENFTERRNNKRMIILYYGLFVFLRGCASSPLLVLVFHPRQFGSRGPFRYIW
jgi:hypothetical protein